MLIERPSDLPGLIHRHSSARFPRNSVLRVPDGQCAIFARDGVLHGMLLTGDHTLAPETVPFLGNLLEPGGATLASTIDFLPIEAVTGVEVRARLGRVDGPSAPGFGLVMRTLCTVRIDDPFRAGQLLAHLPEGRTLEESIEGLLAPRLGGLVANMASSGEIPIGTVGGAALGTVKEALHAGALSLAEIGVEVVDVTSLELRPDPLEARPPAPEPVRVDAPVQAAPADAIRFWLDNIPFHDACSGAHVPVAAHGTFDGDPVPDHLHDWVRGLIAHALHSSAASYQGNVRELPMRAVEWSEWLTRIVSPAVEQHTGLRGRVTVGGVGLPTS